MPPAIVGEDMVAPEKSCVPPVIVKLPDAPVIVISHPSIVPLFKSTVETVPRSEIVAPFKLIVEEPFALKFAPLRFISA